MAAEFRTVYRGEDRVLHLVICDDTGAPVDISGASAISVKLPGETTDLVKTLGSGVALVNSGYGGRVDVTLSASETTGLQEGARQDIYAYYTKASKQRIVRFAKSLTVVSPTL